mmetsp:Transcript_71508/g.202834  ORF Transcript_71508/g.202834 Transcript_71508/m.202834 type:complete len:229 (-) Transcript_71508:215-901(-)
MRRATMMAQPPVKGLHGRASFAGETPCGSGSGPVQGSSSSSTSMALQGGRGGVGATSAPSAGVAVPEVAMGWRSAFVVVVASWSTGAIATPAASLESAVPAGPAHSAACMSPPSGGARGPFDRVLATGPPEVLAWRLRPRPKSAVRWPASCAGQLLSKARSRMFCSERKTTIESLVCKTARRIGSVRTSLEIRPLAKIVSSSIRTCTARSVGEAEGAENAWLSPAPAK